MLQDGNCSGHDTGQRTATPYLIGVFVVLLFILALVKGLVSIREDGSAAPAQHTPAASAKTFA